MKKYKKNRKQIKRKRIIFTSLYILLTSLSFYFLFKSYQYISNIPEANNMTQEEIYDLTRIGEADIKLVRALKNDAFDSWLYEANDEKAKQLPKSQKTISSITKGEVNILDIDQSIEDLQKNVDIVNDSDIEELYVLYYKALLPSYYDKANDTFREMTLEQTDNQFKEIYALLDLLNKIYNQKGMQTVINNHIFKQSISLLEEINSNFKEVNEIKTMVFHYDSLNEPIPEPKTKLGKELDKYVYKTNNYLDSKLMVKEFESRYQELQSNLEINKKLIEKSNKIPDLVGLTIEEAKQKVNKKKLNLTIFGYTNSVYQNGESVPEFLRDKESWDGNEEGIVLRQSPSYPEYDFIIEGATIELWVENKPVKNPKNTYESGSTSTSNSSTSDSSNSEEISSSTTSRGDISN